jgi:hypothetical protein
VPANSQLNSKWNIESKGKDLSIYIYRVKLSTFNQEVFIEHLLSCGCVGCVQKVYSVSENGNRYENTTAQEAIR